MARILFVNIPAHGHVNPTFPLVLAFVKAGHKVDYLISESFRKKVEYCGATFIPYLTPVDIDFTDRKFNILRNIRKAFKEIDAGIRELGPQYDVILLGGMHYDITKMAKEIKKPIIFCSAIFLMNEQTLNHLVKIAIGIPALIRVVARNSITRKLLSRFLLSPLLDLKINDLLTAIGPQSSTLNINFTSNYFHPEASTFDDKCLFIGPSPTISLMDDTFPISKLEDSKKKIIYATLGTAFNRWTGFFKSVIDAFKDSEYLVVMSTGNKETIKLIGDIPQNFIVRDFVPQAEVLKHADLFIAHGGMGSVSDGMYLGVPMILVPLGADQFFNAYRLQELGAGKVLKKHDVTAQNLRREAKLVMENDSFKAAVKKVQQSFISAGGPDLAVRKVEEML
ncbi:macrolide family glycosyltransferase [Pseudobacteroides cellulosolvens]|uniref:Glycosyltransferase, MGT family n=1 Tax=Pseudobacteroides cellulosolvens ATCC 35603 = DSM 2933 TaxID=398512 RepID=A0A0L6JL80_9FIRM|nr:macrolide family glycosyltransferase [Pseudobacteroides cellulosolvens]KNY26137.1 glycosyltransferase, MGT family [Pseudobacteroides cellulosolvens ATCC 35603 = DSM 2933]